MAELLDELLRGVARRLQRDANTRVAVGFHIDDDIRIEGASRDLFEIGSVTKVFVGSVLADFVERGSLTLEDRVFDHLPEASPALTMTLGQLASHTSGLPRVPKNFRSHIRELQNPFAHYTEEALTQALAVERPKPPGHHAYSNYGFAVLGRVLARRADTKIGALIQERVCQPLSLGDTAMSLDDEQNGRLQRGYSWRGRPKPHWSLAAFEAAGALKSSVHDLLRFVQLQTRKDHELAHAFARARERFWQGRQHAMGCAWFSSRLGRHDELWHTGGTGGFSSYVGFVPNRRVGAVVLVNRGLSLWGALVQNPVEVEGRRLLRALVAHVGG